MKKLIKAIGHVTHVKEAERNGQPIGIVEGYLATWDVDRGNDQFVKGAFSDAIEDLQERQRPLRLKRNHWDLIGGFPAESLKQDENGLFGVGEINLNTQAGAEAFAMAKQGVLSDFSVGWSFAGQDTEVIDGVRMIKKSGLWETSIVDEPMNPRAKVTTVKAVTQRRKMPKEFAERDLHWDSGAAAKRWRDLSGSADEPTAKFKNGFIYFDEDEVEGFEAYKLQVVDVVDGEAKIIPRAVFAVRAAISGARGGVEIPEGHLEEVKRVVNSLYSDLNLQEPFEGDEEKKLTKTEVKCLPDSYISDMIKTNMLSDNAIDWLIAQRPSVKDEPMPNDEDEVKAALSDLVSIIREEK